MQQLARIRPVAKVRMDGRTGWHRHITMCPPNAQSGDDIEGRLLADGAEVELPVGAVVLEMVPEGGLMHIGDRLVEVFWESAAVYTVTSDGALYAEYGQSERPDWYADFLAVRDAIIDAAAKPAIA